MDASSFPPPPPAGLNYIAAISPSLNFILVLTPLGAVLVPLILVLFFFSSPRSRRHPVFVFNILACCSGICEAALNAALETKQILYPLEPVSKSLLTSVIAFSIVSPVLIDSILLFRILAFYPLGTTPTSRLLAIFSLPALLKSGRFIAVVLYLNQFTHSSGKLPNVLLAAQSTWPKNPYILTEWSLQMIDNTYASVFFLWKIYQFRKTSNDAIFVTRDKNLLEYLRSLFIIALGNFVFPIVMNIASIVLIATDPSFIDGSYILLSNNYVAIIGVVFATIWTRKKHWNKHHIMSRIDQDKPNFTGFGFHDQEANPSRAVISSLHFVGEGRNTEESDESTEVYTNENRSEGAREKENVAMSVAVSSEDNKKTSKNSELSDSALANVVISE